MKAILYVVALIMIVSPAFAASAELSIGDVSGKAGSNVQIPINLKSSEGIGSIDAEISYDAAILQFDSVDKGSLTENSMMDYNPKTPGSVTIALVDSQGVKGEGSIAVLNFKVLGKEGDKSAIKIESASANEAATATDVLLDNKAGSFIVTAGGIGAGSVMGGSLVVGIVAVVVILVAVVLVLKRRGSKSK